MQPPLARKGYAVQNMAANENATAEPQGTDEDQLDAALQELRAAKAEGTAVEIPAAPAPQEAATAAAPEPAPPAPAPAGAPAPAAVPAQPADELARTQAELHKAQSELGRVSALNRKAAELERKNQTLIDELAQLKAPAQPSAASTEALTKLETLKEGLKEFPELSGLVDAVATALKQTDKNAADIARREAAQAVKQVTDPLEPLRQDHAQRQETEATERFNTSMATFNTTYPTTDKVVATPEFRAWLKNQPGSVQHAYFKGTTPDEAMSVMDTYDAHLRRIGQPSIAATPTAAPAPSASAPAPAKASAPAPSKRLMAAAGMPSRGGGQAGALPASDDFEGSVAFFRNQRLAKQQSAVRA